MFEKVNINYYTVDVVFKFTCLCPTPLHLHQTPLLYIATYVVPLYPNNNIFKRPLKSVNTIKVSLDIIENIHLNLCFNVYNYIYICLHHICT